jgi:hypothetical protein
MKIKDNDIIFLCILLVFGNITNNIKDYKIHPLHNYKNNNIDKQKYTKITKYLYTSIYDNKQIYITLKIPLCNYTYYNMTDIMIYKSTFIFVLNYIFYYVNNDYINCFYINNYILFIIDNDYATELIKKLQILNLDNFNTNVNSNSNANTMNYKLGTYLYFNTYELTWMKYIGVKQQIIFILYLCLFSRYNNNCNIYYFLNSQCNILKYLEMYISTNSFFKNTDNYKILTKIKIIKNINKKYHALNFKYLRTIYNMSVCDTYLNYKAICKNNVITNYLLLHYYYTLFKLNLDKHIKKYKCIINNNQLLECNKYDNIGYNSYNDYIPNNTFN